MATGFTLSGFVEAAGFFRLVFFTSLLCDFFFVAGFVVAEDSFFDEDLFFAEDLAFARTALPDLSFAMSDLSCLIFFFRSFIVLSFFVMPHPPLPLHADRNIGTAGPARYRQW
ncbi:MAG: hypothetical protein K9G60_13500 [Pseudolabrys sp.]|nr:hypothetical protein [Pseudolabrys sp.]